MSEYWGKIRFKPRKTLEVGLLTQKDVFESTLIDFDRRGFVLITGVETQKYENPEVCKIVADRTKYVFEDMAAYTTVFKPLLVWAYPIIHNYIETEILKK